MYGYRRSDPRTALPPPDPREEFEFWGRQAVEHALFAHLGLEGAGEKSAALEMHNALKAAYDARDLEKFLPLLEQSIAFKKQILQRLVGGEWLGWLFPAFVDHVTREEEFFLNRLRGGPPPAEEAHAWLRFMREHAEFASHLVDTTERQAIMQALALAGDLGGLEHACQQACSAQLAYLSAQKGRELDAFFTGTTPTKPLSVIHPVLREHVIREGRRFVETMNRLSGAPPVPVQPFYRGP